MRTALFRVDLDNLIVFAPQDSCLTSRVLRETLRAHVRVKLYVLGAVGVVSIFRMTHFMQISIAR